MDAIKAENLKKIYKNNKTLKTHEALKSINLSIPKGSFFGLLGPNGAGKSTFINILANLCIKTDGKINILGCDLDKDSVKIRSLLGIVPQEIVLDPFFTVRETLENYAGYFGIRKKDRKTSEIIEALGLEDKADVHPRSLSGGMRRRLLVAKALVNSPEILILDEPTAGVDIELRKQLWSYVNELNNKGTTIVLTTHYLEEAEQLCDHIAIINKGNIIANDKTENLLHMFDQKQLKIRFSTKLDSVPSCLSALNVEIDDDKYGLSIKYKYSKTHIDDILSLVKNTGLTIKDLSTKEADLEDIFSYLVN